MTSITKKSDFIVPKFMAELTQNLTHADTGGDMSSAKLIPIEYLPRVIAELDQSLTPCDFNYAKKMARDMIGMYPAFKDFPDPDRYALGVYSIFQEAPPEIVRRVVDKLTRKHRFPPTRADVDDAIQSEVGKRKALLFRARRMEKEHERRRLEAEAEEQRIRERAKMRELHGENWAAKIIEEARINLTQKGKSENENSN